MPAASYTAGSEPSCKAAQALISLKSPSAHQHVPHQPCKCRFYCLEKVECFFAGCSISMIWANWNHSQMQQEPIFRRRPLISKHQRRIFTVRYLQHLTTCYKVARTCSHFPSSCPAKEIKEGPKAAARSPRGCLRQGWYRNINWENTLLLEASAWDCLDAADTWGNQKTVMIPCHQRWQWDRPQTYRNLHLVWGCLGMFGDFPFHPIPMFDYWVIPQPCHVQLEFHWEI